MRENQEAARFQAYRLSSVWVLLSPRGMNKKTFLILTLLVNVVRAQSLPPLFQTTYQFEIEKEGLKPSTETLKELLPFGEQTPAVLSLEKDKKLFLMNSPSVDRCGVLHFSGSEVTFEKRGELPGEDLRFYEKPEALDIYCVPVPFPRCGTFRSSEYLTVGGYLEEQMKLLGSQCEALISGPSGVFDTYRIRKVSNLKE